MTSEEKAKEAIRLIDEKYTYLDCVERIAELFDQHAAEQRQMCAAEVTRMEADGKTAFTYEQLRVRILSATGEE